MIINNLGDTILGAVGKVLPQPVINGVAKIEQTVNDVGIELLAKKSSDNGFKYFSGAAEKMETAGDITKEFVRFCQTYIYIPTVFVLVGVLLVFAFGNIQEKSQAKKRILWVACGIAGIMSTLTITSMLINALSPSSVATLNLTD